MRTPCSVCVSVKLFHFLSQLRDFDESYPERYAIGDYPNSIGINFL
jgi:hypothetical protein